MSVTQKIKQRVDIGWLFLIILGLAALSACGKVEHSGKVRAEISLDAKIEAAFKARCTAELTPLISDVAARDVAVAECTQLAVAEFLESLGELGKPVKTK